jgi:uncharacterized protein with LGFP repeats
VHGEINSLFVSMGAERGPLGYPTSDESVLTDRVGRSNTFQNGAIFWTPTLRAHEVRGLIYNAYRALGAERSYLGYPTTNEQARPDGVGRSSSFQRGMFFWSRATGAHAVRGAIQSRYAQLGYEAVLGYPTSDELTAQDQIGRYSTFTSGTIFWTSQTGAHEVRGAIRDRYVELGAEHGDLGYPISNERTVTPGVVQTDFQHGSISWTLATGETTVTLTPAPTPTPTPSPTAGP